MHDTGIDLATHPRPGEDVPSPISPPPPSLDHLLEFVPPGPSESIVTVVAATTGKCEIARQSLRATRDHYGALFSGLSEAIVRAQPRRGWAPATTPPAPPPESDPPGDERYRAEYAGMGKLMLVKEIGVQSLYATNARAEASRIAEAVGRLTYSAHPRFCPEVRRAEIAELEAKISAEKHKADSAGGIRKVLDKGKGLLAIHSLQAELGRAFGRLGAQLRERSRDEQPGAREFVLLLEQWAALETRISDAEARVRYLRRVLG